MINLGDFCQRMHDLTRSAFGKDRPVWDHPRFQTEGLRQ